jgi:hypothetical protein
MIKYVKCITKTRHISLGTIYRLLEKVNFEVEPSLGLNKKLYMYIIINDAGIKSYYLSYLFKDVTRQIKLQRILSEKS